MRYVTPTRVVELGPAWAGSSVNCKPYAVEALVHRQGRITGSFFAADGSLAVFAVGDDGTVEIRHVAQKRIPQDAHDTPALQFDNAGRLHVFGGAHVNRPLYLRGEPDGRLDQLVDRRDELPKAVDRCSYPTPLQGAGRRDLILLFRDGHPGSSAWTILRWHEGKGWARTGRTILSGIRTGRARSGPYLNQPIFYDDGRIGLAYVWRSTAVAGGRQNPMNIGLDYLESSDGFRTVRTVGGWDLTVPVSPANSERVVAVPWGSDLANQCGSCPLDGRSPAFVSTWRRPGGVRQIEYVWRSTEGAWHAQSVTATDVDFHMEGGGTLATPMSRPVVVAAGSGRVVVIWRDDRDGGRLLAQPLAGPDFRPDPAALTVLVEGGLDQYEPVVERSTARTNGRLHVYVQRAEQVLGGDHMERRSAAPACLMTFEVGALFDPITE